MPSITISNKARTKDITIRIPAEDMAALMRILTRNAVPFIVHGNVEGEYHGNQNSNR